MQSIFFRHIFSSPSPLPLSSPSPPPAFSSSRLLFLPPSLPPAFSSSRLLFLPPSLPPAFSSSRLLFLPPSLPPAFSSSRLLFLPPSLPPAFSSSRLLFLPPSLPPAFSSSRLLFLPPSLPPAFSSSRLLFLPPSLPPAFSSFRLLFLPPSLPPTFSSLPSLSFLSPSLILLPKDIFECRTCGLTGSLCCCTECAYTCHRGHDCSFKRSSPTAYCDCWEGNKCHSLATGSVYERKSLLNKLLNRTDLGMRFNGRHQHLVGMLTSTVIRQQKEQAHYTGLRTGSSYRSTRSHSAEDIPIYDLSPPKFAQKGLAMVLENWPCVRALMMCDAPSPTGGSGSDEEAWSGVMLGTGSSKGQTSTVSLDAFTHLLLTKLNLKVRVIGKKEGWVKWCNVMSVVGVCVCVMLCAGA